MLRTNEMLVLFFIRTWEQTADSADAHGQRAEGREQLWPEPQARNLFRELMRYGGLRGQSYDGGGRLRR